jgi:hypothetical protein
MSRPKDFTFDPTYRRFVPIPNTPGLIKFNAKPRVDVTSDTRNSGNPDRFVPALGNSARGLQREWQCRGFSHDQARSRAYHCNRKSESR